MNVHGVHKTREAQIREVFEQHPHCASRSPDNSVLDFGLQVSRGGQSFTAIIRITLPPEFPIGPPSANVIAPLGVRHPWIDVNGKITKCQSLIKWDSHSRLTQVIADIIHQFVSCPPTVGDTPGYPNAMSQQRRQSTPPPYGHTTNSSSVQSSAQRSSMPPLQSQTSARPRNDSDSDLVFIPHVPDKFPELDNMTIEELEKLQNDSEEFTSFFENLPMPTMTNDTKAQIIKNNVQQAETNLTFKDSIENLQADVLKLQQQAVARWNSFKKLEAKQDEAMKQYDPLRLLTQLESSCKKIDDESELLASEFLGEEIPLSDFIKREMELRKLYHLRKAKAERFRFELKRN